MPPVQLTCPYCTGQFQADDALAGQAVGCPICGGLVGLAGISPPDYPPLPDAVPPPPDHVEPPPACPPPPDLVEPLPVPPRPGPDTPHPVPPPIELPMQDGECLAAQIAARSANVERSDAHEVPVEQPTESIPSESKQCSTELGGDATIAVDTSERPMFVGDGLEAREVRVLSAAERYRRRTIRNLVMMLLGIAILAGILTIMVNR